MSNPSSISNSRFVYLHNRYSSYHRSKKYNRTNCYLLVRHTSNSKCLFSLFRKGETSHHYYMEPIFWCFRSQIVYLETNCERI